METVGNYICTHGRRTGSNLLASPLEVPMWGAGAYFQSEHKG